MNEKPNQKQCLLKAPGGPKEAQEGSQKYLAGAGRCNQLFEPCWAHFGLSDGPRLGGRGGLYRPSVGCQRNRENPGATYD